MFNYQFKNADNEEQNFGKKHLKCEICVERLHIAIRVFLRMEFDRLTILVTKDFKTVLTLIQESLRQPARPPACLPQFGKISVIIAGVSRTEIPTYLLRAHMISSLSKRKAG